MFGKISLKPTKNQLLNKRGKFAVIDQKVKVFGQKTQEALGPNAPSILLSINHYIAFQITE